jgi:hypothetical protein
LAGGNGFVRRNCLPDRYDCPNQTIVVQNTAGGGFVWCIRPGGGGFVRRILTDRGGFVRRHWLSDRYDRPTEAEDRARQRRYIATGVIRAIDRSVSLEDCTKMSAFFRRLHGSVEGCRVCACALFERSVQSSKVGLVQNKESSMERCQPWFFRGFALAAFVFGFKLESSRGRAGELCGVSIELRPCCVPNTT